MDGKLELLFAHLSLNNVVHIRPLLLEAIDEYQNMCTGLSYEARRKISFINTLLWHAERGEWQLARECLRGAEAVYQEYLRKKMSEPQVFGSHIRYVSNSHSLFPLLCDSFAK